MIILLLNKYSYLLYRHLLDHTKVVSLQNSLKIFVQIFFTDIRY